MQWQVSPAGYLSTDLWALKWSFVRAGSLYEISGSPQDDGSHLATIDAADSLWVPGVYDWQCRAKKDDTKQTIDSGRVTVLPSFEEQDTGYDGRTHTEKVLEAIRATIEGRASKAESSWSVDTPDGSRTVGLLTPAELMRMERVYEARLAREKQEAATAKGFGASRLLVRLRGQP